MSRKAPSESCILAGVFRCLSARLPVTACHGCCSFIYSVLRVKDLSRPGGVFCFPCILGSMKLTTLTLSTFATLKLTRFITRDTLGDWLIVTPAERWAKTHDGATHPETNGVYSPRTLEYRVSDDLLLDPDLGWRSKLVSGLSCPHCVGFWITSATLAAAHYTTDRRSRKLFNAIAGSLGLSYITGHIAQRLDS